MRKDVNNYNIAQYILPCASILLVIMLVYILLSLFTSLRINLHLISQQELSCNQDFGIRHMICHVVKSVRNRALLIFWENSRMMNYEL